MTEERFIEILKGDSSGVGEGCNALAGLKIIAKYLPKRGVEGADHDVIYSVGVREIVEAGITEEDAEKLRELNWMVEQSEWLACYV